MSVGPAVTSRGARRAVCTGLQLPFLEERPPLFLAIRHEGHPAKQFSHLLTESEETLNSYGESYVRQTSSSSRKSYVLYIATCFHLYWVNAWNPCWGSGLSYVVRFRFCAEEFLMVVPSSGAPGEPLLVLCDEWTPRSFRVRAAVTCIPSSCSDLILLNLLELRKKHKNHWVSGGKCIIKYQLKTTKPLQTLLLPARLVACVWAYCRCCACVLKKR